jgi:hypothetical protein
MKKIIVAVCLFVMMIILSNEALAAFYDGNDLVDFWRSYKVMMVEKRNFGIEQVTKANIYSGYVAGVADAYNGNMISIPSTVTVSQLCEIVGKYLEDNPDLRHAEASGLVLLALGKHYPMPKQK